MLVNHASLSTLCVTHACRRQCGNLALNSILSAHEHTAQAQTRHDYPTASRMLRHSSPAGPAILPKSCHPWQLHPCPTSCPQKPAQRHPSLEK